MIKYLLASSLLISIVLSSEDDHDHDEDNRHENTDIPVCECITGITPDVINCALQQDKVNEIESLLISKDCISTCPNSIDSGNFDLKCAQLFGLYIQYHDLCELLTVNETLIHNLWDNCYFDCLEQFPIKEGAPYCPAVNCSDQAEMDVIIDTAVNYCNATSCMAYNMSMGLNCTEQFIMVEAVHRGCALDAISTNFDTKFDTYVNIWGQNCEFECNLNTTVVKNCSDEKNTNITNLPNWVPLDLTDLGAPLPSPTSSPVMMATLSPTINASPVPTLFYSVICLILFTLFE